MLSDRQMAKSLQMSYDTLLRWRKEKPLLYRHIKEGFELKEMLLGLDTHLKTLSRKTDLLAIKEKTTEINGSRLYEVQNVHPLNEAHEFISQKSYIWLTTKDSRNINILTYREDVFAQDLQDPKSPIYVEIDNYRSFTVEDDTQWLVSDNLTLDDSDEFFQWYSETAIK